MVNNGRACHLEIKKCQAIQGLEQSAQITVRYRDIKAFIRCSNHDALKRTHQIMDPDLMGLFTAQIENFIQFGGPAQILLQRKLHLSHASPFTGIFGSSTAQQGAF